MCGWVYSGQHTFTFVNAAEPILPAMRMVLPISTRDEPLPRSSSHGCQESCKSVVVGFTRS